MITRRTGAVGGALLAGALVLAGCSGSSGTERGGGDTTSDGASGDGPADATITVAHEAEFNAYNNNTADQNAVQNTVVLNQVLRGFWDFGPDGGVQPDPEFGTYEKTSDDPLTVDYTIADDAVWSDDTPIDCVDVQLTWAANSGKFASEETDEDGNPLTGFSTAGTTGYELMNQPECEAGDKEFTVTYTEPFADWNSMFGAGSILPAHVVEREAGVDDLIAAITDADSAALDKAAQFYNTGWIGEAGTIDPDLYLSAGPYGFKSWQAGQSLTLEANPAWWGEAPGVANVVVRFIDATQQATALQNGEIQVAAPQPAQDILNQLEAVGDSVVIDQGDEYTYEHLDPNFQGVMADADLRRAFALCVPRQQIVDTLIKPVNDGAEVLNSLYKQPFQDGYSDVVSGSYEGQYDQPDVAGAKAILDGKGAAGTPIRIGYQTPNQRRTDAVKLIADSCNQAGFDIQDAGQAEFFGGGLAAGDFDVALFAWSGSPIVSGNASTYVTDGGNNNGKYSNPQVDELVNKLNVTPDESDQTPIITDISTILWDDVASIPLFTFPGLEAHAANIEGPSFQPAQSQQTWNMQTWKQQAS